MRKGRASLIVVPCVLGLVASLTIAPAAPATSRTIGRQGDDTSQPVQPVLYQRSNYAWPFASGPVYGTMESSRWRDAGVLHTQVGSFDLTRGMPNLPSELRSTNRLAVLGAQYFVLQVKPEAFTSGAFDEMKHAFVGQGGAIVGELPVAAFVVRMTQGAFAAVSASDAIIALVPYQPAFKLSPEIGRVPLPDPVKANSSVYSLALRLFPGENGDAVATSLAAMGVQVERASGDMLFVEADRSKLAAIATLEPVFMIDEVLPIFPMSEETTTTVQTGKWNNGATPYNDAGIDGGGLDKVSQSDDQLLMILDTGIQLDAGDLSNTRSDAGVDVNHLPIAGHRKVAFYGTTNAFGGVGDLLGCDANTTSGVTHGHTVAVVALGNATKVPASYGAGWSAVDLGGNPWGLDGLAPKARLIAYDAQITPATGRCDDPTQGSLLPGDLYTAPNGGSLADGYAKGARVVNFSWGSVAPNIYDADTLDIDQFLLDKSDAMVFIAAGNSGRDKDGDLVPDPNTIGSPGASKNALVVGASRTADDLNDPDLPNARWWSSSVGPATIASGRIAPLLMAPGADFLFTMGLRSEFHCRSNDNGQSNPVECDVVSSQVSTSYASAAAAGAGLLVRDYFAQGFYPDGNNTNPGNPADKVATISGALLKAVLVASADWMNQPGTQASQTPTNEPWVAQDFYAWWGELTRRFRGNREQGFGRIQLTNALPLATYPAAVTGLIADDGGGAPAGLVHGTTLNMNIAPGGNSGAYALNVCDTSQPLTIVIAWIDPSLNDVIARDLNLEVTSPSGRVYLGNFFTDDTNDDTAVSAGEECTYSGLPWPRDSVAGVVDTGPWSLPSSGAGVTCTPANHIDTVNNVEAIFLSPDSRLNGINDDPATTTLNEAADNQVEQGAWSVVVKAPVTNSGAQNYSIAIAGGVCLGSAARIQKVLPLNQLAGGPLTCNDSAVVTIDEVATTDDPVGGLTAAEIASRTRIDVVDASGTVTDTETLSGTDFTIVSSAGGSLRFESKKVLLTEGTAPDSGNGALDVRDGQTVRVTYQDENPNGTADPNAKRIGTAPVGCKPILSSGGVVFAQLGKDTFTLVNGGCEKDARGYFTFGFPDRYMDAGELLSYTVAFQSAEQGTRLLNLSVSLKAVTADADSPASCAAGTAPTVACPDPNRTNNPISPYLTVLDSPKIYGSLPSGRTITPSFTLQMAAAIPGTQKVDMLIGVTAKTAGKSAESLIAKRETLNADEFSFFYSTDFPTGGSEPVGGYDINNNEILETVTSDPRNPANDYVFESQVYSDMTVTNPLVDTLAPWNFDLNDGNFRVGLQNTSRPGLGTVAQWGEDKNFNGKLDGFCSLNTAVPCTQGDPGSEGCRRCSGNSARACLNDSQCQTPLPNEGTCGPAQGTCLYSLGEDRDPTNTQLDMGWSTLGGCGWQTKATPASLTGGVWHTGLIRDLSATACLAGGNDPGRCQSYETLPDGDLAGDNNWWELLLTPVLNKVNQGVDGSGDPVYQVAIANWAWNTLADIPDENTAVRAEFDTDINKTSGAELFNDGVFTFDLGWSVKSYGPYMFARVSHCVDTDGNGSPDRCGTAIGKLCGSDPLNLDLECTGNDLSTTRGTCSIPPAQKRCTANMANCTTNAQCSAGESCVDNVKICSSDTDCLSGEGTCLNAGHNRQGKNNCFFEGKNAETGQAKNLDPKLARPPDDDVANGYCRRSDGLDTIDKSVSCISITECANVGAPYTTCDLTNHPGTAIDAFVQNNGPGRNFFSWDSRFVELEDVYGDTGNQFRAALGFNTREADPNTAGGPIGFGLAVDDMVISWKETRLDEDTHDCAGSGECATLQTASSVSFEGNSVVNLTVTDKTPYDVANNRNDCNGDGDYLDAADDQDCNDNGKLDVTVKLTSAAELAGELAILDQVSPGSAVYRAAFPYSTFYDSPGTLFVVQSGTDIPRITARYEDRNDGTGSRCKNFLDPSRQGFITAETSVNVTTGLIGIQSYTLNNVSVCSILTTKQCTTNADCLTGEGLCNSCSLVPAKPCTSNAQCLAGQGVCTSTAGRGDPDGFADTNETVNLAVQFANKSGVNVDDLTATLGTNSPTIECITRSTITVGALANGAVSNSANYIPFQFKVAPTVSRTSASQVIQATFTLTLRSNKFDALTRAVDITLDLDLNAAGSAAVSPFIEDFEAGTSFGKFTLDTIDANKNTVAKSNGYRCQYNDPFGLNSNSTGNVDCFLGFTTDTSNGVNDWHIHTSTSGGMGRAFSGKQSLHMGVHLNASSPDLDTQRLKQLDAIKTVNAIFMPLSGANPELNFAQQVSFLDGTNSNTSQGETIDRGVVEVQLATTGVPSGSWIKIYPYVNVYDQQGTDDFTNCTFDPTDDGNNEDSFFDPTDPGRRTGPSSTCYPEFAFARQGQTDYRKTFDVNDIGLASDGPGLQGCSGAGCLPANTPSVISNPGTWVRPRFSLVPFAGRAIRVRFLFTSAEVGVYRTYYHAFNDMYDLPVDDGWYIDDIRIDQALGSALTLSADTATITPIPCGACSAVIPALTAVPGSLSGPGQIVTLDARNSTVDRCLNGIVQFQFWNDANANGVVGDAGDTVLRDWTDNSSFVDAPQLTTQYGVKARCSTDTGCDAATSSIALNVPVACPTSGTARAAFNQTIAIGKSETTITWPTAISVDAIRGDLGLLRSSLSFTGTVLSCLATNSVATTSITDGAATPGVGNGFYYLVRGQTTQYCNQVAPGYTTNAAKEKAGRDAQLVADPVPCP